MYIIMLYSNPTSVTTPLTTPPTELLKQMFDELYDKELITEESFRWWKDNGTEKYGKGNCIQNTRSFYEWLDNASAESDEAGAS